ncbi:chorismate pyruvate-lyase family protein [Nonomuraea turcica]|uniref:chorismate pyruvate-lyase family protein n=1 Tax=Nonomuraea sp. G32 TaxID=3067274 RepID=UPI00273C3F8A|nr:chorismate pyruvate-lyase family protein [Nonomuraea sp. G32]MDP4511832.1 chorismate pyruvate-lyase family protein [Nonomuraea sp. G32]
MTPTAFPAVLHVDAHTLTRILLAHDGSTTNLLATAMQEPLSIRVVLQASRPAAGVLATKALARMGAASDDLMILRRSQLILARTGVAVTANKVVLNPRHPSVAPLVDGIDVPIGPLLAASRVEQHRELLDTGVRRWSWGPPEPVSQTPMSVWRSYVIVLQGRPALYVEEVFHPDLIPALPSMLDDPGLIDEPSGLGQAG